MYFENIRVKIYFKIKYKTKLKIKIKIVKRKKGNCKYFRPFFIFECSKSPFLRIIKTIIGVFIKHRGQAFLKIILGINRKFTKTVYFKCEI